MMSRLNFITILFIGFVDYLGIGLVYPVFAAMIFDPNYHMMSEGASSGYRGAILGILIGLTPLTQFFSSPLLGALSDLKGRKKTLLYGTIVGCLGYFLAVVGVLIHSLALLFFYRILVGISAGTVGVAQAMVSDISDQKNKGRRFALFNASLGLGFTVGPFIGGKLVEPASLNWTSYSLPFVASCVICLFNLAMIMFKFPETKKTENGAPFKISAGLVNISKIFQQNNLRWIFFATFAFSFGWSFFNEFIPVLLKARFEFSPSDVGNYYAYGGAWYAMSASFATAPLLKYFSPERVVSKALFGCAVCMLAFIAIQDPQYIWWLLPPFMYCLSITYPTTATIVSNSAKSGNQGEMLGIYQSVVALAMGLSPFIVGSLIGVYPEMTSWGGAMAMLLASFAFRVGRSALARQVSFAKK